MGEGNANTRVNWEEQSGEPEFTFPKSWKTAAVKVGAGRLEMWGLEALRSTTEKKPGHSFQKPLRPPLTGEETEQPWQRRTRARSAADKSRGCETKKGQILSPTPSPTSYRRLKFSIVLIKVCYMIMIRGKVRKGKLWLNEEDSTMYLGHLSL